MSQSDDGPGSRRGEISPEERDAIRRRALELGERIEGAKAKSAPAPTGPSRGDSYGQAFKMAIELVAGVIVGGGIGWVLDSTLGTRPWLMIVFFFLGFAAGLLNLVRSAQRLQRAPTAGPTTATPVRDDDDDDR
jgi:ATP synthase protein I